MFSEHGPVCAGDNEAEAKRIGMSLGIGCVEAGLTPQGKLEAISRARSRGLAQSSSQQAGVIMVMSWGS